MTSHTRAPWHRTRTKRFIGKNIGAPYICTVEHNGVSTEEFEANSNLLWAAPELLAALNGLLNKYVQMVNSGDCGFWDPEWDLEVLAARAAVAKATTGDERLTQIEQAKAAGVKVIEVPSAGKGVEG